MKYVLILGAGFLQKPAIESALELGLHVTVVDGNANAVCIPLANSFEHIDLKDIEALLAFATSLKNAGKLDAVFTAGTDFSCAVSYIAQNLNLPAHSFESAFNATDKISMRTCFKAHNVASPAFACVDNARLLELDAQFAKIDALGNAGGAENFLLENLFSDFAGQNAPQNIAQNAVQNAGQATLQVNFPLVVKPVDNMGARACKKCHNAKDLLSACKDAISFSRSGRAIVEEFMDGREFSIDSLVYDGKIVITGFADRHIFYPPYFIEMGHTLSTNATAQELCEIASVFAKGVGALGLTHGAAKGDMKFTKKGAMIGEIAARLSGGYMSGWTFPYASGINLTKMGLELALGKVPKLFFKENLDKMQKLADNVWYVPCQNVSAERAWISIPGVVQSVYGLSDAEAVLGVKNVFVRAKKSDAVVFPQNNVEKCGNVIAQMPTREQACKSAENAVSKIIIRLCAHNSATDAFLQKRTDFPPSAFALDKDTEAKLLSLKDDGAVFDTQKPIAQQLPAFVTDELLQSKDFNHRTLQSSLDAFCALCPNVRLPFAKFWRATLRGGIQAMLYLSDCACTKD